MKSRTHPNVLQAIADNLFREQVEPYEHPVRPGFFGSKAPLKNRRDPEKLRAIIQRQLNNYLSTEKDSDKFMFRQNTFERIDEIQAELCKDHHKYGKDKERSLYKDLEAYKAALFELVPDEVTQNTEPKDPHPKEHYFTTPDAYRIFKYLCDNYSNKMKSRWTYILQFMVENDIDRRLNELQYFQWVRKNYQNDISEKRHPNASSKDKIRALEDLYKTYPNVSK